MAEHPRCYVSHTIEIAAPAERVFPMFTPEGERQWVAGWEPRFVPSSAEPSRVGSVFWTDHDGENTLWMVADLDHDALRARYVRHTPGSRVALVEVTCAACAGGTRVSVSYDATSLSDAGDQAVSQLEAQFADAIGSWKGLVESALG